MSLPPVSVHHPHIEARVDRFDGSPYIRDTRILVRTVWGWWSKGVKVETLVQRYPMLKPSQILSALAFACDNRDVIAADEARARALDDGGG